MTGRLHRKRDTATTADAATGPEPGRDAGVRITGPEHSSVGLEGIAESLRYTLAESGPVRGAKTLLAMNQVDGFDCPSCAWGDPAPEERKRAEFC